MDQYGFANDGWRGGRHIGGRGGRGRARGRGRGRGRGRREFDFECAADAAEGLPPSTLGEDFEPCKVFIANLRARVNDRCLFEALSCYVPVKHAFVVKDKFTRRSRGYGFATVKSQEDVQKLLHLRGSDLFLYGQEMKIQLARKRIHTPGDGQFWRRPLSDRSFDLSPANSDFPTIHILVDDVLIHILGYLKPVEAIQCERVCRRWQMLIYRMFAKSSLELSPGMLGLFGPLSRSIVSKLLILSGLHLKELSVKNVDCATKSNILKVIGQLCPEIEFLDVSMVRGINFSRVKEMATRCPKLKSFIATRCPEFDEKALRSVLEGYPDLERLNISGCPISGRCFDILAETLKELKMSYCHLIESRNQKLIGTRCPNLEVLHMDNNLVTREVLEHIGEKCSNIQELTISLFEESVLCDLPHFTSLKSLTINCDVVDLSKLFKSLPNLKHLTMNAPECVGDADFSTLKDLTTLKLHGMKLSTPSIESLVKCSFLEMLHLKSCRDINQDSVLRIIRECQCLKSVRCPDLHLNLTFISSLNKIMASRSSKIKIGIRADTLSPKQLLEAQYDNKKIEFDLISNSLFAGTLVDDDDDDDNDEYFDGDSFYSDGSFENWIFGYDSDDNIPDELLFGDPLGLLHYNMYDFDNSDNNSDISLG